jgi:hypothetical protein
VLALGLSAVLAPGRAEAEMFTVGQDFACTHVSIQAALDAARANGPGSDQVVVTEEMTYTDQALDISDHSVELSAGYSCEFPDFWNMVTIRGNGLAPVIRAFTTSDFSHAVTLRNLVITGGGGAEGGGIRIVGAVRVALEGTWVRSNAAQRGGGVAALRRPSGSGNGGVLDLLPGAEIAGNLATATDGGGIYLGPSSQLHIAAHNVRISGNTAAARGGGVAVEGGSAYVGVNRNVLILDATGAVLTGNHAGTLGGGLFVTGHNGANGYRFAHELAIENNSAGVMGGGLVAQSGGRFDLRRDYGAVSYRVQCPQFSHCSRIAGNTAPAHSNGVGVALLDNAQGAIRQTEIRGHAVGAGSALYVDRSTLDLENTLVTGNHTRVLASGAVGVVARLGVTVTPTPPRLRTAYTTFAGNTTYYEQNGWNTAATDVHAPQGTRTDMFLTAMFDSPYPVLTYSATHTADCVFKLYGGGYSPDITVTRGAYTYYDDARLQGPTNYRPRISSPLVDYCDVSNWFTETGDLDLRTRCFDRPENFNDHGPCDVGAFESAPAPDTIFADGFDPR